MPRHLVIVGLILACCCLSVPARGELVLISANRSAGASGSVGDDDDFFSDGSFDFTNDFGGFIYGGGVNIKQPQGSVDGFGSQDSNVGSNYIAMNGAADANVSAGNGEFDYASGGGNSSLYVTFRSVGSTALDINYSGGGYPAYVEPYFQLFQLGISTVVSYGSGSVFETIIIGPGLYGLSAGISAGASTSFPGDSGAGFGGISFSVFAYPVPEPASVSLAGVAALILAARSLTRGVRRGRAS